jgi:glyoxylase-like metal-dependent hydrolase (beta-lactamase superfamily II)
MARRAWSVEGNRQKLDGGAMFGNAPRALWTRWATPDAQNRIDLACRCLLVEEPDGRRVLCETGVGAFFAPELRERFGVDEPGHVLLENLAALGLSDADIDVVVLSHLHFDHAGGLLAAWEAGAAHRLLFPKARFLVGERAWARAKAPHPRDRASFIPELVALLEGSGRLEILPQDAAVVTTATLPGWRFHASEGHTPGLVLAEVPAADGPVVFGADLIPGVPWVHVPVTMGYDRAPEVLVDEKAALLADLVSRGGRLFFTHDPAVAMATVTRDASGRFGSKEPCGALAGLVLG